MPNDAKIFSGILGKQEKILVLIEKKFGARPRPGYFIEFGYFLGQAWDWEQNKIPESFKMVVRARVAYTECSEHCLTILPENFTLNEDGGSFSPRIECSIVDGKLFVHTDHPDDITLVLLKISKD